MTGLLIAACATPGSVALLSFSLRQVLSPQGVLLTLTLTAALLGGVYFGRTLIPPAPLAMPETAVGHGSIGSYECLPGSKHSIRTHQLDGLRCGSMLREPGGIKETVVHAWSHRGTELRRVTPERLDCDGDGVVFRSTFPQEAMPEEPTGMWSCTTFTLGGQLVGVRKFEVVGKDGTPPTPGSAGEGTGSAGSSAPTGSAK